MALRICIVAAALLGAALLFFGAPAPALAAGASVPLHAHGATQEYYKRVGGGKVWTAPKLVELIGYLSVIDRHGLRPADYHIAALNDPKLDAQLKDVLATDAFLSVAAHLLEGKLNPISVEPSWTVKGRSRDLVTVLQAAIQTGAIAATLDELVPIQPGYARLVEALARIRKQSTHGGWEQVADGPLLKPGMSAARVAQLANRLKASGDLKSDGGVNNVYDAPLVEAVQAFQRRTNLEPDGVVGPATLRALNHSPQDRIDQLRVNLERWRWLPDDLGSRHIRVNIADYRLDVFQDGQISRIHDVVVGRTYRQTPVFTGTMSYLVLNPWWEVPHKLASQDILKKFQADATIIARQGYHIYDRAGQRLDPAQIDWQQYSSSRFPFRLRQMPGKENALGVVKFMFPNEHNVYLHDTASRDLFGKTRRDFSSGCVRVKDPVDLVEWVLRFNTDWARPRIDDVIKGGQETKIVLAKKIPVHLLYWTAVPDAQVQGGVRFVEDIYDRDERVLSGLNKTFARP